MCVHLRVFPWSAIDCRRRPADVHIHLPTLFSKTNSQVIIEVEQLRKSNPDAIREDAIEPLLRGVASHHAGCLPAWKLFIEKLFQKGLLKVVISTETLAAGINMPARTTVIKSCAKNIGGMIQPLPCSSLMQMAGRAGRRSLDTQGLIDCS